MTAYGAEFKPIDEQAVTGLFALPVVNKP